MNNNDNVALFEDCFATLNTIEQGISALVSDEQAIDDIESLCQSTQALKTQAKTLSLQEDIVDLIDDVDSILADIAADQQHKATPTVQKTLSDVIALIKIRLAEVQQQGQQAAEPRPAVWEIVYQPNRNVFQQGLDPLIVFQQLARQGDLDVVVNDQFLPLFWDLEPDQCYLAWSLILTGDIHPQWLEETLAPLQQAGTLQVEQLSLGTMFKSVPDGVVETEANQQPISNTGPESTETIVELIDQLTMAQSALSQLGEQFTVADLPRLNDHIEQLAQYTDSLRAAILHMHLVPIAPLFEELALSATVQAQHNDQTLTVKQSGQGLRLDKAQLDTLQPILNTLVTQALQHIGTAEARAAAGKPKTATLQLSARQQGQNIIVIINDDGLVREGDSWLNTTLDNDENASLAAAITQLAATVEMDSSIQQGTTVTLTLPCQTGVIQGQMVSVANQRYLLPLTAIIESREVEAEQVKQIAEKGELYPFQDSYIPIIRLEQILSLDQAVTELEQGLLVIVDTLQQPVALFVDDILSQENMILKPLETHYQKVMGFLGAGTISDGSVVLTLDIEGLLQLYQQPDLIGDKE